MPSFACPDCNAKLTVPEKLSGKTALCNVCKTIVPVPYNAVEKATPQFEESASKQFTPGIHLFYPGIALQCLGGIFFLKACSSTRIVLNSYSITGIILIVVGVWFLFAGIARWAVAPVIAQNEQVFRELQKTKSEQND